MITKGAYWGNFYIPIEYKYNERQTYDVINHELAHALLTESTSHGLAFYEFSSLSSENIDKRNLLDIMKILQDSSERVEECFAMLFPLVVSCENDRQLLTKFNVLRETEYYYRYNIVDFEKILFADVTLKEKEMLIYNILFACMNTNIFSINCDWFCAENVYQIFTEKAQFLIPDKRLKLILEWVNKHMVDSSIFSLSESVLHEKVLGYPMPSVDLFEKFRKKVIDMADRNGLDHNFTNVNEIDQYMDETIDINSIDRVYFHPDDSAYVAYGVDIPTLALLECDTLLFFPLERKEFLVFTSCSRKEKYKLELPIGSLSNQFFEQFSGIIIAYLDDSSILESKVNTNKKLIYKSVCSFEQLEKILLRNNIEIEREGIFQFDNYIGSPFFIDINGTYYCGGPRSLEVLLRYTKYPLEIVSPETCILNTNITAFDFQVIISSDIAINDNKNKRIAVFDGSLDKKIFSSDAGIDSKEICGYYLGIFDQLIKLHKCNDAQNLFNFMLNLFDDNNDRRMALLQIDNTLTRCKRAIMNDIKKDTNLLKGVVNLYSMVIQGYKLLELPTENICTTLTNLANLYLECNQFKEANEYAALVLELRTRIYGNNSPKLARSYYLLGTTLLHFNKKQAKYYLNTAKELASLDKDLRLLSAIKLIMQQLF